MNYKEEYQNALERAKQGLPIDEVFPELKESEDEGIRKFLVELVSNDKANNYNGFYEKRGVRFDDVLAYLEKQKEYISNNFDEVWEREDCSEIIAEGEKLTPEFEALFKKVCHAFFDKGVELTIKQKEQKPTHDDLQKSFEAGQTSIVDNPERYGLCKKAEWNEEDEKIFNSLCNVLHGGLTSISTEKFISWLKNRFKFLHPQPHWKPSEDQMEALLSKLPVVKGSGDKVQDILESLYNDLKKLI